MKKFASKFEERVSQALNETFHKKKVKPACGYETTKLNYVLEKVYNPDWTIDRPDGTTLYLEAKGYFDPAARTKMQAVKKQHPDLLIAILFQQDNVIRRNKKSVTYYSDWAKKNGFEYSVGTIPLRWLLGSLTPDDLKEKEIPV